MTDNSLATVPVERIEKAIYVIRGEKVMLDRNLADLYGVETRVLNQVSAAIATVSRLILCLS